MKLQLEDAWKWDCILVVFTIRGALYILRADPTGNPRKNLTQCDSSKRPCYAIRESYADGVEVRNAETNWQRWVLMQADLCLHRALSACSVPL